MDCLYCTYIEMEETAVGICRCGVGLCRHHMIERAASRERTTTIGMVTRTVHYGSTERHILCPACAAAAKSTRTARVLDPVD